MQKIAETVGVPRSQVSKCLKEAKLTKPMVSRAERLNREAVLAFLDSKTHREIIYGSYQNERIFIGGVIPPESFLRTIIRWRTQEEQPSLSGLDRWLTALEIPLSLYFDWCEREGRNPWG